MYTLEKYHKDLLRLTNSLVIKLVDVGIAMNYGLAVSGYSTSSDLREWKYYLNLAGKKHVSNSDVKITIIETGVEESLSAELLAKYPYSRMELLKDSTYTTELIEKYPDDVLFIKGCIMPVDIDTAINAPDGTILNYNHNYVESSEYHLISELEAYIKSFLSRWLNKAYIITNELYLPSLLGVLYANIYNKIDNIRISYIGTSYVHSFHLENYFRSRLDLWDEIQILKPKTIYWLYNNLDYLMKHVGKEKTFNIILDKIFDDNNTGVGEYKLRLPDPTLNSKHLYDPNKPFYLKGDISTLTTSLNKSFGEDESKEGTIEELLLLEMTKLNNVPVEADSNIQNYTVDVINTQLENNSYDTVRSKVLTVGAIKLFKFMGIDIISLVIDYWAKLVKEDVFNTMVSYNEPNIVVTDTTSNAISYVEPNTNQYFILSPKNGLLLLIKQLLYITGNVDIKLSTIKIENIISTDTNRFDSIVENIYADGYSDKMLNIIKSNIPPTPQIISTVDKMGSYINEVINFLSLVWTLDSNAENVIVSANIKNVMSKLILTEDYVLTDGNYTIDELLAKNNIIYNITSNFDVMLSIRTLIMTFTGIDIDIYSKIEDRLTAYTKILNKLTSYTLQVINAGVEKNTIPVYYNNLQPLITDNGLVTVLDSELIPLEQNYLNITSMANDFRDKLSAVFIPLDGWAAGCSKSIVGVANIYKDGDSTLNSYELAPIGVVEIIDDKRCDILGMEFKDDFILSITADFLPFEPAVTNISVSTDDFRDRFIATSANVAVARAVLNGDKISGVGIVVEQFEELDVFIDAPAMVVELYDDFEFDELTLSDEDTYLVVEKYEVKRVDSLTKYRTITINGTSDEDTGTLLWTDGQTEYSFNYKSLIITRDTSIANSVLDAGNYSGIFVCNTANLTVIEDA